MFENMLLVEAKYNKGLVATVWQASAYSSKSICF